jgi:hypothetical protein
VTTTQPGTPPAAPPPGPPAHAPAAGGPAAAPAKDAAGPPAASHPAASHPAPARTGLPVAALPQLTRILGTIVAPTTLLTSLLFYFGWSHAFYFFDYFGVNSTLLGLTNRDYVQRSLDGLFVPMIVVACAGLVVLWGHAALHARIAAGARPPVLRTLVPAIGVLGLVLATLGVWSVFTPTPLRAHLVAAPLSLAFGVLLLIYAIHLHRSLAAGERRARGAGTPWAPVAEWAAVFVLVGLSLFWAANDYSAAVGRSRARHFVATLATTPGAVVYSAKSLSLTAPGVRETRCQDPDAAYRFRYDGLKLVLQSGDQYLFLPAGWSPRNGVAILMPRSDSLRLELIPAAAAGTVRRPAC